MNRVAVKNGTIIDGSGKPRYTGHVYIENGCIAEINKREIPFPNAKTIDASGRIVAPGFIDIHRHCDYALLKKSFGELELAQGITAVVTGSCGLTAFPLNPAYRSQLHELLRPCLGTSVRDDLFANYPTYAEYIRSNRFPLHIGNLVGSCSVRIAVKGFENTPFSAYEMEQATELIGEAMGAGALGLSMGIMYYPEYYSTKDELIRLAKAAARQNGILTCHIRGEGDSLLSSIAEILHIARQAEIPLQISHFKACGAQNWNRSIYQAIEQIEEERNRGMDVGVDFYPYEGGSTVLLSLIPPDYMKSTLRDTCLYMSTSAGMEVLRDMLQKTVPQWDNYALSLGFGRIIISSVQKPHNMAFIGKSIADISRETHIDPYRLIGELMADEEGMVGIIVMSMSREDVDTVAKLPYSFLISDALYADTGNPHPRLYGAFPKFLRDYVKERKILTAEEAIRKMTDMPAKKMGIKKRGLLKEGYAGDLCVFDMDRFCDHATYEDPRQPATGMDCILIGGHAAWQSNRVVNRTLGKYIRHEEEIL